MNEEIIAAYLPELRNWTLEKVGTGLIHRTWKVMVNGEPLYILQQVNTDVFISPDAIEHNLGVIGEHLRLHEPDYFLVLPLRTVEGKLFVWDRGGDGKIVTGGCFRMFTYVENSRTIDVVSTAQQAYEAARQFGKFTRRLEGIEMISLRDTLPGFHDLGLRYRLFEQAVRGGSPERLRQAGALIAFLEEQRGLVTIYKDILASPDFVRRVTHHDTKISNLLFDAADKGICVIDLDTVMPGYYISDVGDMIRTYVPAAGEEETDLALVEVREDVYQAIHEGYMAEMGGVLSAAERAHFSYAGHFMVYMQALRFLTDYLMGDVYYGARYAGHNFNRAANQVELLRRLMEKKRLF